MAMQDEALGRAAEMVRPGGRLVYVTCSLLRAENRERVDAFLGPAPGLRSGSAGAAMALRRPSGPPPKTEDVALTPASDDVGGFYVAALRRG